MYLLYLRYKAFLIRHKKLLRFVFIVNTTYLGGLLTICCSLLIMGRDPTWLFRMLNNTTIISSCLFIPLVCIFDQLKLTDLQKKVLCINLKTGYERCDKLIDMIIVAARQRESILHFSYKGLETSGVFLNATIDEPVINPSTINDNILEKYIIYKMPPPSGENWLYLKEFLVAYTDNPLDCVELEKTFIEHLA